MKTAPIRHSLASFSLLLSASLWGLVWYPLRLLEQAGLAGLWTLAMMYSSITLILLLAVWRRLRLAQADGRFVLLLMLTAGWCNVAFALAMLQGEVVRVLLLFFLSPVWSVLLARILLKEPIDGFSIGIVTLGMMGCL
ncbi:MAG: EamA family transporter [gamma proteobacterium symbiont of Bathyaustriella thionipta]|nr:EamA family transporter [gamma proteobacterium symbiont of Bathyaustriella thionipta]